MMSAGLRVMNEIGGRERERGVECGPEI